MIYFLCVLILQLISNPVDIKMSDIPTKPGTFTLKKILKLESEDGFYSYTSSTMTPDGERYIVLDQGNKVVVIFDKNGNELKSFGSEGNGPGEFMNPNDIYTTTKQILIVESLKAHLFDMKGNFIKQVSMMVGGKVPYVQVLNDEFYFVQFDNKNPKYLLSKLDDSGKIEYLIKNSDYEQPKLMSYSIGAQPKTYITTEAIYKANDGDYKIYKSNIKEFKNVTKVLTRNFQRVKQKFINAFKDPKTEKFVRKETFKETSDIISIIYEWNDYLFVKVTAQPGDRFSLIDIIKGDELIDQLKVTGENRYYSYRIVNNKLLLNDYNNDIGPYVSVFEIVVKK